MPPPFFEFGRFTLEPDEHRLLLDGVPVPITPKALDILVALVRRAPRLVSKDQLLKDVWPDAYVEEANLAVHISALRRALNEGTSGERFIETVPRRGYRFVAPVRVSEPPEVAVSEPARGGGETDAGSPPPPIPDPGPDATSAPGDQPPLEPAATQDAQPSIPPSPERIAGPRRRRWPVIAGIAAIVIAATSIGVFVQRPTLFRRNAYAWDRFATEGRLTRLLSSDATVGAPAISPDGTRPDGSLRHPRRRRRPASADQ
jgi:DNA-binding winged helix-turn-helix (wHTH) protein